MPRKWLLVVTSWLFVLVMLASLGTKISKATITSCISNIYPDSILVNSTGTLTFSTKNDDSANTVVWVKITSPSTTNFSIQSGNASEWTPTLTGNSSVTFTSGTLGAGSTKNFDVSVTAGASVAEGEWIVETSDALDGTGAVSCNGARDVFITDTDVSAPTISSISVSDIGATRAKVNWNTNESSNSTVEYGTTTSYGSSVLDPSSTTSHGVTITNLTKDTTYHFKVKSSDATGNQSESGDNTFHTGDNDTVTTVTTTKTIEKIVEDTEKPVVALITKFDKPFTSAPKINGKVTDNAGVATVEYSIDGGGR